MVEVRSIVLRQRSYRYAAADFFCAVDMLSADVLRDNVMTDSNLSRNKEIARFLPPDPIFSTSITTLGDPKTPHADAYRTDPVSYTPRSLGFWTVPSEDCPLTPLIVVDWCAKCNKDRQSCKNDYNINRQKYQRYCGQNKQLIARWAHTVAVARGQRRDLACEHLKICTI